MRTRTRRAVLAAVVAGALAPAGAHAATESGVYWGDLSAGTIGHSALDGTGATPSFLPAPGATGVAIDGRRIYWANIYDGRIGRASLDGTGVQPDLVTGATLPIGVAADDDHVFWTNGGAGTIGRANADGTGVQQAFVSGVDVATGVAVDGDHLYWADSTTGDIGRADLDGTDVDRHFIPGVTAPYGLAVDDQHLYWTSSSTGRIARANLDGTGVEPDFVTGASVPVGVAVDADHVVWTNASGSIGRSRLDGTGVDQSFVPALSQPFGIALRANAPTATVAAPTAGGTYAIGSTVAADYACARGDGGTLESCVGSVPDGAPLDTAAVGPHTFTVTATGGDGQTAAVTRSYAVKAKAPSVALTTPTAGASYAVGDVVPASFSCAAGAGSTLASCVGTVPNGSPIDTATAGAKSFGVKATGGDGQSTTATRAYAVTKATTRLTGISVPLLGEARATLTGGTANTPLAGRTVRFATGGTTICTGTTDAAGRATCNSTLAGGLGGLLSGLFSGLQYTVSYAGDANTGSSSATGGIGIL